MSTGRGRSQELIPQLQAELAEFEDVLREYQIDLSISNHIPLSSMEYEDSKQILEEFLKIQDGLAFNPENLSSLGKLDNEQPLQQPVRKINSLQTNEGKNVTIDFFVPDYSSKMVDIYIPDVNLKTNCKDLNVAPESDIDFNIIELNDLFSNPVDHSGLTKKLVLEVGKPQTSKNLQRQQQEVDDNEHEHNHLQDFTAQMKRYERKDTKEISVEMCRHILTREIPVDNEDFPENSDDISTEPEDYSTDEDFLTESIDI